MSYTDDERLNTFTYLQSERMWGALDNFYSTTFLNGQRSALVSQINLLTTGVNNSPQCGPGYLNSTFKHQTMAVSCTTASVQFQSPQLPNYLSAISHTWNFGDGSSSNQINPLHIYNISTVIYTVSHSVSDGSTVVTSSRVVNFPSGLPEIFDWSGRNNPVCRGTEQTIYVKFPPNILTAYLTDGVSNYVVNTNWLNSQVSYIYPFTFSITNNCTWSLSLGSCATITTVASFTVEDCCPNLVYNGDLELGPIGYNSQYTLTQNMANNGFAAVDFPNPMFINETNLTGKQFMIDSYDGINDGCNSPNIDKLLLGQTITGLKPNKLYYVSFKCNQSLDSSFGCSVKYRLKIFNPIYPNLLIKTIRPTNVYPLYLGNGATGLGSKEIHNYTILTPSSISSTTSFNFELREVDNRWSTGFDCSIDNLTVAEIGGMFNIIPASSTIIPCPSGTVQLNTADVCSNLSNCTLLWQPSTGLSCSNCPNPVATVSITTVYTLFAIPPISVPPSPVSMQTATVYANGPAIQSSSAYQCNPVSCTLSVLNAQTATWQPGNVNSTILVVQPTITTNYSVTATIISNNSTCIGYTVFQVASSLPSTISVSAPKLICRGQTITLTAQGAVNYTWSTGQTGQVIQVTPIVATTYTVVGKDIYGCPTINTCSVHVKISNCVSHEEFEDDEKNLIIFPNPNQGIFTIQGTSEQEMDLYNNLGIFIRKLKPSEKNNFILEISDLPDGIYYLKIEKENKYTLRKVVMLH